jgi:hypothetical protein
MKAPRKNRIVKSAFPDPTVPEVSVEIDGSTYRLCFDFAALAVAKAKLREAHVEINVLGALNFNAIDVDTLPALFFAATQAYHPDLSWEQARGLVSLRTAPGIFSAVRAAYIAAMIPAAKNPPAADRRN